MIGGMALYRNEPIEHIVDMLDLALPDKKDTLVAKTAIAQARRRLTGRAAGVFVCDDGCRMGKAQR